MSDFFLGSFNQTSRRLAYAAVAWALAGTMCPAQVDAPLPPSVPTPPSAPAESPDQANIQDGQLPAITLKDGIKQLKRIRLKHFGSIRNTEIRQLGISKLKDYTEYKFYPHLIELFEKEGADVQQAVLDLLADQQDDRADTTIAYAAIFSKNDRFRELAATRLASRMTEHKALRAEAEPDLATPAAARVKGAQAPRGVDSGLPWRVKAVLANGIKSKDDGIAVIAANLAADLNVFDLIPALINAQVQAPTGTAVGGGGADDGGGALAYIMVGTQQAFVSDLEPVVGDSAVAFDPQLSVVTSGTVMRVVDAAVVTYRTEVHYALRRLANAGWDGRETDGMGYDQKAWRTWYANEFVPYRTAVADGHIPEKTKGPD